MSKCRDDLTALTRYVTWTLEEGGNSAITRALPDQNEMVAVYQMAIKSKTEKETGKVADNGGGKGSRALTESKPLNPIADRRIVNRDFQNLLHLMEEAIMSRHSNRTTIVVGGLVQHIVSGWQDQFCRSVTTKFNCYFMLPFVDQFHRFLREELRKVYEGEGDNLTDVFDLTAARKSLEMRRDALKLECAANKKLQKKFKLCAELMKTQKPLNVPTFEKPRPTFVNQQKVRSR